MIREPNGGAPAIASAVPALLRSDVRLAGLGEAKGS